MPLGILGLSPAQQVDQEEKGWPGHGRLEGIRIVVFAWVPGVELGWGLGWAPGRPRLPSVSNAAHTLPPTELGRQVSLIAGPFPATEAGLAWVEEQSRPPYIPITEA